MGKRHSAESPAAVPLASSSHRWLGGSAVSTSTLWSRQWNAAKPTWWTAPMPQRSLELPQGRSCSTCQWSISSAWGASVHQQFYWSYSGVIVVTYGDHMWPCWLMVHQFTHPMARSAFCRRWGLFRKSANFIPESFPRFPKSGLWPEWLGQRRSDRPKASRKVSNASGFVGIDTARQLTTWASKGTGVQGLAFYIFLQRPGKRW